MERIAIVSYKDGEVYRASHLNSLTHLVVVSSDGDIYYQELPSYIRKAPPGERGPNLKRYIEENFDGGLEILATVRPLQVEGPYPWRRNGIIPEGTEATEVAKEYA